MKQRNYLLYLTDIIESIEKIERYSEGLTFDKMVEDEKTRDAIIRNIEIIGEASKNVPDEIINKYPEIDWKEMSAMRNKLIHGYFSVSDTILWETIQHDLLPLKNGIIRIIKEQKAE